MTPAEARTVAAGLLGAAARVDPEGHQTAAIDIAAAVDLQLEAFVPNGHGE
jgi:hypothetical protein